MNGKIYLIPNTLGDVPPLETMPLSVKKIIEEINENSNIQIIAQYKSHQDILDLIDDLFQDHKDQSSLKKIESLEKKLINNLDENSYSELIKLKSQLNRD